MPKDFSINPNKSQKNKSPVTAGKFTLKYSSYG
jgi:hypothetical protein